jgi:predicted metal-dependent phosphoesterase TrpH
MMFADLHLHTRHSDGTYTPEELVSAAHAQGLSLIAVTDHDTTEACAAVKHAAGVLGLGFIPGTEITAELHGRELHILGYFLNTDDVPLRNALAQAQAIRQKRVREMVARLNARNVPISAEAVFALANCSAPGRPHVARALVQRGFCSSLDEAFERYLKKDRPGWVPKEKMSTAHAVALIHAAGGLAVMAHPGLNHDDSLIGKVARLGVDGLECFHPRHPVAATQKYLAMARKFGLLVTGGSDCHGTSKNRPTIGTVKLSMEYVDALRVRHSADRLATA